ncbi:probable calcium-binding protein CML46 [Diospyros lotus]|uniref:probable calcium-binding protein CML46 n=1 Tax=Diospyros lotus TaxID=55363 RepID=UPI0022500F78|nr:probable calcium-binding protein CML46 [Diospyros lotus]
MEGLGISCDPEEDDECLQETLGSDEISNLFEEKGPSMDEVKAAFDVFDENGDGFIEAKELQRVLCVLGFKEGLEVENCRRMIDAFDKDGDGRIDFGEFLKFMENTIC